ncbi:MAG: HAMP domain-containing protein [Coleofasciculaceae cyanobacterium SM2_1_6]|nr:HAMP domain-containing protein [Coleofasciculaceae cyanobacterium SM2_1_6]
MAFNSLRFSSRGQSRSLRYDLSLRTVLIVPFVVQIAAAVGLVGYLSFRSGQNAINDLVNQLENQAVDRVNQHLDVYLASPHQALQIVNDSIQLGLLDVNNFPITRQYFWRLLQRFETISSLGLGNEQEKFTDVKQIGSNQFAMGVKDESTGNDQIGYLADEQGNLTDRKTETIRNYRPTIRPWYQTAKAANRQTWTKPFQISLESEVKLQITAVMPYRDRQGNFAGVLGTSLRISHIAQFLNQIKISPSGRIFIMERDGMLVANSNDSPIFTEKNGKAERLFATNSSDPLIQEVAKYLAKSFPDLNQIKQRQKIEYDFNGQRQFVLVEPWQDKFGLNWLIVTIVPESDFMTQINTNTQTTIILCILALVVAIVLGFFTTRWIVGSILKLRDASQAIAEGNLEETIEIQGIVELKDLAVTFNQMGGQLKEYFDNLENLVAGRTNELQQTLEDLKKTQSQLIQSEKMSSLGQLVAGVAHEINNPVNFIHGNLRHAEDYTNQLLQLLDAYASTALSTNQNQTSQSLLKLSPELEAAIEKVDVAFIKEDLPKLFHSMQKGTERIQSIVESLRTFSRLGESTLKTIDLNHSLDSTLVLLHHRFLQEESREEPGENSQENLLVQVKKNYTKLPPVKCYAGQINQVFMNILTNALDALEEYASGDSEPDWRGEIQISTTMVGSDRVRITITDNAAGIPSEFQERVFDPFFTTKPVGKGTGLGMAVSYQTIVQGHRGSLSFHSVLPHGTEFAIEIPLEI